MPNMAQYMSERMDWATPQRFFDRLDVEFGFTLDAAASVGDAKCDRFFTREDNGLFQPWSGVVWCNPPYGHELPRWLAKAKGEARRGSTVVMLLPSRTESVWWGTWVLRAAEVRFVQGRLTFGQGEALCTAPFPSAVVVFRPGCDGPPVMKVEPRVRKPRKGFRGSGSGAHSEHGQH